MEVYENVMFDEGDKKIVFEKIGYAPHHIKERSSCCFGALGNFGFAIWKIWKCQTDLLKVDNFLEKGAERLRANAGPWPTFTNPVKKVPRPAIAAGLKTASEGAKNR